MNAKELLRRYENGERDFSGANLSDANLRNANLYGANLYGANLSGADLSGADLSNADLRGANLRNANLYGANLSGANLSDANLRNANLYGANLYGANLSDADLRGAKGLITAREFMAQFDKDELGWIVYKTFGEHYAPPSKWVIEQGAFIAEVVNQLPTLDCACGVNFATMKWIQRECSQGQLAWRCRIRFEDGPDITVPYNTDGKARCGRLQLLEIVGHVDDES